MKIARVGSVKGFSPTTYAVFDGAKIAKIFVSKDEAEDYVKSKNETNVEDKRCS